MSAPADSERKGHKRKLADTFTYSNAVAGNSGGDKDSLAVQVRKRTLGQALATSQQHRLATCPQVKRLVNIIKGFTEKSPDSIDRTALRRAAHSLAELSKSGKPR